MATARSGSKVAGGATITGVPLGARVSPVVVSLSLATANRSPAGTSVSVSCSLPLRANRACSFSSLWERGLVRVMSGLMVPESTFISDTRPT